MQGPGGSYAPVPALMGLHCVGHWIFHSKDWASSELSSFHWASSEQEVNVCPEQGRCSGPVQAAVVPREAPAPSRKGKDSAVLLSWKPKFVKVPTESSSHIWNHFVSPHLNQGTCGQGRPAPP